MPAKGVFTYLWTNRNPGLEQEKGMELSQACALATVCAAHWRTLWSGRPSGTAAVNSSHRREGLSGLLWDRLPSATYRDSVETPAMVFNSLMLALFLAPSWAQHLGYFPSLFIYSPELLPQDTNVSR